MSAEELRAQIEATRREAEAEEARLPELQAETAQARERQRLRLELRELRDRLGDAYNRNSDEVHLRCDIDEELWETVQTQTQPVMQASGCGSANFGALVAKGEYVWRIEGFSWVPCALEQVESECVESTFHLASHTFLLQYSPSAGYLCREHRGTLAITVHTEERIALRYRIYVKARNGEFVQWGETCDVVHRGGSEGWNERRMPVSYGPDVHLPGHAPASLGIFGLSHKELLQSQWVENDTLTVKFELEVRPPICVGTLPLNLATEVPDPTILEDTRALLEEGTCSDVRFMVQGEEIQAHSQVLCARSEVFSKQLTGGMQESISKVIVIEDCDVDTFRAFLQFLYTDRLPDDQELLPNPMPSESGNSGCGRELSQIQALLAVSHKYQVKRLQLWCEAKLSNELSTSGVCGILCQAHLLQAKQLEKACLAFIKEHAGQVLILPAYVDLVKSWPKIGMMVSLFSAGVPDAELSAAMDGFDKSQTEESEHQVRYINGAADQGIVPMDWYMFELVEFKDDLAKDLNLRTLEKKRMDNAEAAAKVAEQMPLGEGSCHGGPEEAEPEPAQEEEEDQEAEEDDLAEGRYAQLDTERDLAMMSRGFDAPVEEPPPPRTASHGSRPGAGRPPNSRPEPAAKPSAASAQRSVSGSGAAGYSEPAIEVREERRVDPEDGVARTYKEFQAMYTHLYSPPEIREYWNECRPEGEAPAPTPAPRAAPAKAVVKAPKAPGQPWGSGTTKVRF
ncbi:BPM6 [Symbiodinium sp. CCMP2592]|nr:BPM6 [Symbiodinium sp. CCMP2592]